MQLKIGLPYQIYVNAPRAKFGGLGCRVWAAVGARLLKVGLSVLTPPLERGGNAVLGTGWYRTVCGFERRRYKAGTPFIIGRRHSDVNPYDGGEELTPQ